jgi:hypothetical protein
MDAFFEISGDTFIEKRSLILFFSPSTFISKSLNDFEKKQTTISF